MIVFPWALAVFCSAFWPTARAMSSAAKAATMVRLRFMPVSLFESFIDKFLNALPFIGLPGIDIAFGIDGDAAHSVEVARKASAVAKAGHDFQRVAAQHPHFLVLSIGDIEKLLLWIA